MAAYDYTCPFCGLPTTITEQRISDKMHDLTIPNAEGLRTLRSIYTVCPNPKCRKVRIVVELYRATTSQHGPSFGLVPLGDVPLRSWTLLPPSNAKAFPDYVPQAVREDYEEACQILEASPKAAATLARRALQGMIRDFWTIQKPRLVDEIDELRDKVDVETWKAIDGLRQIGNIGAHMEKDVNLIIDIEPDEAKHLVWLIELLVQEWYVARHERKMRLSEVALMAEAKKAAKSPSATPGPARQ